MNRYIPTKIPKSGLSPTQLGLRTRLVSIKLRRLVRPSPTLP